MTKTTTRSPGRFAAILLVFAALGVAACGSNSLSSSSSSTPAQSQTTTTTSGGASSSTTSSSSNGIPQGANAGDADSDNHGAPSDGDGNL